MKPNIISRISQRSSSQAVIAAVSIGTLQPRSFQFSPSSSQQQLPSLSRSVVFDSFYKSCRSLSSQQQALPTSPTRRHFAICSSLPTVAMAANSTNAFPSVVDALWLKENFDKVKLLDATWYMPNVKPPGTAAAEYLAERIPGAKFFDLDQVSDQTVDLPHMLPTEHQFAAAADALDISNSDSIVIYDHQGIFSAPRAWWTFHVFGHENVAVLDGGLAAWKAGGGQVTTEPVDEESVLVAGAAVRSPPETTHYKAKLQNNEVKSWQQVLANIETKNEQVMDARPAGRFRGEVPEPRPGLRQGHIPGSFNVPWNSVLTADGKFLPANELEQVFAKAGLDLSCPLLASCGSGTTACILALAVKQAVPAAAPVSVYDASWSEWGREDLPVAKK